VSSNRGPPTANQASSPSNRASCHPIKGRRRCLRPHPPPHEPQGGARLARCDCGAQPYRPLGDPPRGAHPRRSLVAAAGGARADASAEGMRRQRRQDEGGVEGGGGRTRSTGDELGAAAAGGEKPRGLQGEGKRARCSHKPA
jgi:hypothetical protein